MRFDLIICPGPEPGKPVGDSLRNGGLMLPTKGVGIATDGVYHLRVPALVEWGVRNPDIMVSVHAERVKPHGIDPYRDWTAALAATR